MFTTTAPSDRLDAPIHQKVSAIVFTHAVGLDASRRAIVRARNREGAERDSRRKASRMTSTTLGSSR